MTDLTKRTWAEVDLSAIEHNFKEMKSHLPAGGKFLGVVKADSYGHGAVPISKRLQEAGCDYLAVACLDEARILRDNGITLPLMILGYTPPEYARELAERGITQAVGSLEAAKAFSAQLAGTGLTLKCHLKLETGMGRTGFRAFGSDELADAVQAVALPGLDFEGIFTHFCVSDGNEEVRKFTNVQFERFTGSWKKIEELSGHKFAIHHCTNSGAMISFPETYSDMVRPGLALYGYYPGDDRGSIDLQPVMSLYSRVAYIVHHEPGDTISYGRTFTVEKPSDIAVLPIGYADGLIRLLSNRLKVIINGQSIPQVGRICMDMCMLDVTGLDVKPGDVAEIFGKNQSLVDVAALAETIPYELCSCLTPRVPRIYVG